MQNVPEMLTGVEAQDCSREEGGALAQWGQLSLECCPLPCRSLPTLLPYHVRVLLAIAHCGIAAIWRVVHPLQNTSIFAHGFSQWSK